MNNYKYLKFLAAVCLLAFPCNSAFAGSYWGIGAGTASSDLEPLFGSQTLEDSPMLKVVVGLRNDNHAFELDIAAGVFDWENSATNSHTIVVVSGNILGYLPVGESFELFAKIGANTSSTTVDYQGGIYEGDSGFGVTYGAGFDIKLTDKFALRAEYQKITGIDDGVDSGDLDWVSFQAIFGF